MDKDLYLSALRSVQVKYGKAEGLGTILHGRKSTLSRNNLDSKLNGENFKKYKDKFPDDVLSRLVCLSSYSKSNSTRMTLLFLSSM